jgi:hypothetical protein
VCVGSAPVGWFDKQPRDKITHLQTVALVLVPPSFLTSK